MSVFTANKCGGNSTTFHHIVSSLLKIDVTSFLTDVPKVCEIKELQLFLVAKDYNLHPCENFRNRLAVERVCSSFLLSVPPAVEVSGAQISSIGSFRHLSHFRKCN